MTSSEESLPDKKQMVGVRWGSSCTCAPIRSSLIPISVCTWTRHLTIKTRLIGDGFILCDRLGTLLKRAGIAVVKFSSKHDPVFLSDTHRKLYDFRFSTTNILNIYVRVLAVHSQTPPPVPRLLPFVCRCLSCPGYVVSTEVKLNETPSKPKTQSESPANPKLPELVR